MEGIVRSPIGGPSRPVPLLFSLLLLAGLAAAPPAAEAQERALRGVQVEGAGLWTTFVGGAFPFSESGFGGTLGAHYRWPTGVSVGVTGLHAQPEDLSLPVDDVRRHMTQWGAFAEVRYYLAQATLVQPYLGARGGWTQLDDERGDPDGVTGSGFAYGLSAGADVWATDRFAFRVAATGGGFTVSDYFEEGESSSGGSWTLEAGVSVFTGTEVARAGGEDSDGDGVPDARDECNYTPVGVEVDSRGCPIDADRDGIADYRDDCPGTWAGARVDAQGCALDDDGDGIPNGLDRCPDTPEGTEVDDDGCAVDGEDGGAPNPRA